MRHSSILPSVVRNVRELSEAGSSEIQGADGDDGEQSIPAVRTRRDEVGHGHFLAADGSHAHVRAHRPLEVGCRLPAVAVYLSRSTMSSRYQARRRRDRPFIEARRTVVRVSDVAIAGVSNSK